MPCTAHRSDFVIMFFSQIKNGGSTKSGPILYLALHPVTAPEF